MLFKRYLFLAACVLLFIFGFIGYFTWARAQMESRFHDEREKYSVQGMVLTSTNTAPSTPVVMPTMAEAPASDTNTPPATSTPDASSTTATTPTNTAPSDGSAAAVNPAATDPNVIIGPVPPPPSTPAPDSSTNTPTTTPVQPDSSSAPMSPSGMNEPRNTIAPFLVRAAYHPLAQPMAQVINPESTQHPALAAPAPVTNAASASTNTVTSAPTETNAASTSPATNAVPSMAPVPTGTGHPSAVEASVIVLLYHQFAPEGAHIPPKFQWTMNVDVFEAEMKYIHDNGYHVIPMSDLIKFLNHQIGLPPNSVVITIDDGYKSAIVYAAPILKKYGYPWTYFVYPDFITVNEGKGAASWSDLLALQADGVDIESHSMTHPTLTKHTQKWKGSIHALSPEEYDEWLTNETLGAKTLLEQKMGKPIISFAYPYGAYNKEVEAKSIAAGYQYIFTVADNPVHSTTDPHSIGRYTITQGVEKDFAAYLRQGALGLAQADPAPGATITDPRPVITAVLGYAGNLDPNSIETSVRDFGVVKHDFDPKTSTIRLYLPRDLIQPVNLVNIRVKDAQTGQVMVANWHFNYAPIAAAIATHAPIASGTNSAPTTPNAPSPASSETPMAAGTNIAPMNVPVQAPVIPSAKPPINVPPSASSKVR